MEVDIDVIVDVEPDEANKLIWLIEYLLNDWYITREERRKGLEALERLAGDKEKKRESPAKKEEEPI